MDSLVAGVLSVGVTLYFLKRNVPQMLMWILIGYLVSYNFFVSSRTISLLLGIGLAYAVCYISTREHFEDENVIGLRNYQARFLCNAADNRRFESEEKFKLVLEESVAPFALGFPNTWFVGNELTSLDLAKSKLDQMSIVGTSDNIDPVLEKIKVWFLDNYNIEIEYLQEKFNSSSITEDGIKYTTEDCVAMLTEEEINTLKQLNSIDQELYEYAKILSM